MANPVAGEVTELLVAWSNGDRQALARLLPKVYDELRRLASSYLRHERPDHTLETRALAHEAYLRLVQQERVTWRNRAHFFGVAAQMMRRILVDHARSHGYAKRAGGSRVSLVEALALPVERAPDLVALDEALTDLATIDAEQAKIVELRFFGGLKTDEIAQVLGISTATVARRWRMVKAWLYHHLGEGSRDES